MGSSFCVSSADGVLFGVIVFVFALTSMVAIRHMISIFAAEERTYMLVSCVFLALVRVGRAEAACWNGGVSQPLKFKRTTKPFCKKGRVERFLPKTDKKPKTGFFSRFTLFFYALGVSRRAELENENTRNKTGGNYSPLSLFWPLTCLLTTEVTDNYFEPV
jgi:hypothetical protein